MLTRLPFAPAVLVRRLIKASLGRSRHRVAKLFCALIESFDLHLHKLGLNFHHVLQILGLAQFLYEGKGSGSVFGRVAQ